MKIIDNYKGHADNQIAAFKNEFIQAFWKSPSMATIAPKLVETEGYFTLNRAMSDAIDKMVYIVQASYTMPRDAHIRLNDHAQDIVFSQLTRLVADQILQADKIPVELYTSTNYGDKTYRLTLPVIVMKGDA